MKKHLNLILICLIGLILHLIAYPFVQIVHADAVTRIFEAEVWLENPKFISSGIWLPFHHYLNALAIAISGGHKAGPIIMHILFGTFTVIPIYFFTKREFSEKGAWFSAILYILSPVIFRNSFYPLSEIPFAFFIAFGMNLLSKAIREKNTSSAMLAGLFATIGAGCRYEGWILILIFTGICVYFKQWKSLIGFCSVAFIMPAFWLIGNYLEHHDFLYGVLGNDNYLIKKEGINEYVDPIQKIKRLIFFPVFWFLNYFPPIALVLIYIVIRKSIKKELVTSRFIWATPFFAILGICVLKAWGGTLGLQPRFTTTLMVLSVPFASVLLEKTNWNIVKKIFVATCIISILPMSYKWMKIPFENMFGFSQPLKHAFRDIRLTSIHEMPVVPRLSDQNFEEFKNLMTRNLHSKDGLILDFVSWESTYYLAFESGLKPNRIYITDGARHGKPNLNSLQDLLNNCETGVIMLNPVSKLNEYFSLDQNKIIFHLEKEVTLQLTLLRTYQGIQLSRFKRIEK